MPTPAESIAYQVANGQTDKTLAETIKALRAILLLRRQRRAAAKYLAKENRKLANGPLHGPLHGEDF